MIVSEKSYQKLSEYVQFLVKKDLNLMKKGIIYGEKVRKSGNYICDYANSFFGDDINPMIYIYHCTITIFK